MWDLLSQRLLPILQLTRMALVFTAIADSYCTILLLWKVRNVDDALDARRMLSAAAVSIGLYGFGMSLNDIIDRRRDRQISPHRPLPSGRVGVVAAHVVCFLLIFGAIVAGILYSLASGNWMSLVLVAWTGLLISFYDIAGKYLVGPGLLTLGLIRFFHCLVPGPQVPVLWHPLLLLNHVTILSAVAYVWEQKRPTLTKAHWWGVLGGLGLLDVMAVLLLALRRGQWDVWWALNNDPSLAPAVWLALPVGAAVVFVFIAWAIRRTSPTSREAGQHLMLYGLLWLIVYDTCFVAAYAGWIPALLLLLLLPAAYLSVQLMRWWSKLVSLSQRPAFKRARA